MYIYIYIYIVCVYIHIYIYIYTRIYAYLLYIICIYIYIFIHIHTYIYVYTCLCSPDRMGRHHDAVESYAERERERCVYSLISIYGDTERERERAMRILYNIHVYNGCHIWGSIMTPSTSCGGPAAVTASPIHNII